MSNWQYKDGSHREFIVPVDCFVEQREWRKRGFLYMNSARAEQNSSSEIIHEDGHTYLIEWTGPGHLRFNLDEEGNIDSYQIDYEMERVDS